MDALKTKFKRIAALTGTRKILAALVFVIAIATVVCWGRYAHRVKMVPILGEQILDESDIGPIDRQLELSGVPHSVHAGKIIDGQLQPMAGSDEWTCK